jgi:hypothetical protein
MKVTILKCPEGKPIGWTMEGENREELNKLCDIRNLQFFGCGDTAITYNGRKGGDDKDGNPGVLSWVQRRFSSDHKR